MMKQSYWAIREWIKISMTRLRHLGLQIKVLCSIVSISRLCRKLNRKTALNRHILFVSYYASPYKSVCGTQRIGKFIKYLNELNWKITLLSSAFKSLDEIDFGAQPVPKGVRHIRTPISEPSTLKDGVNWIPDSYIGWIAPAVKAIQKIVKQENISLIFSSVPPYSNALAGSIAAKQLGLPHLVDFRDPWSQIDVSWVLPKRWQRWLSGLLEKQVLKSSAAVIMADDKKYADDFFIETSGSLSEKLTSLSNGYDEDDFQNIQSQSPSNKFALSYVGVFYDQETFEAIIKPLQLWQERYPDDFKQLSFEYAGHNSDFFDRFDFRPDWLIDHGFVTHLQSIAIRCRSSLQLFAQPVTFKRHVMSGKIYEMIAVDVPILALTHSEGGVADLMNLTNAGFVMPQNEHEKTAERLKQLFEQWRSGKALINRRNEAELRKLTRKNLTLKLNDILEGLLRTECLQV